MLTSSSQLFLRPTLLAGLCLLVAVNGAMAIDRDDPQTDLPLVAHWTFGRLPASAVQDDSGNGYDAIGATVEAVPGVQGTAGRFVGQHRLHVPGGPAFDTLDALALSAWVRPESFDRYNEIFRKEDGDRRVLFSFQEHGTVLALGLNVGGYIECDAPLDPKQVLDGGWHHVAASFDGETMRVYLDGREIGSLQRRGKITAGGPADGCIGSSNGGECFQGAMDDLRIHRHALSEEAVAALYQSGVESLAKRFEETEKRLASVYNPHDTFAQTLAESRRRLAEAGAQPEVDLAHALIAKLKADFPEDYQGFVQYTSRSPLDYLLGNEDDALQAEAERLIELLAEYKPLTEQQWARQTPEEVQHWREVASLEAKLESLQSAGPAARHSPQWIDLILEAGPKVEFRPQVHEAVAPYVRPQTPETRELSPEEARHTLKRDWLHQCGGNPSPERIRQEIRWTRQLAERIAGPRSDVSLSRELAQLAQLEGQTEHLDGPDAELYFQVREVKRAVMFSNPVVDFDRVLFVDMPYPAGSEWPHETRHRLGYMAVPGGRLLVLDGLSPAGTLTQLMPQPPLHGSFWRPDLSFDAQRVLFCFKPHNEKAFHLYEVGIDGTGLRQLTDGIYDDLDPIYLPDGHILFSTTRGHTYVRCMPPTNAFILARCNADGEDIYLVSRNNEPDYLPSLMHDGRVIYTRWEYTDKPLWRAQKLWTMNPDGTQVLMYWGNQSVWPDLVKDARVIPGSHRVMVTGSAHHNWFAGSVGIVDPNKGLNFPQGITKVTADVPWPECGNGPVDPIECEEYHSSGQYAGYYSPYPLSEEDFLVSANRGDKFVLYLMDVYGNRELIYEGTHNIFHAIPVRPRPCPPVIADRVAWPSREQRDSPAPGIIYSGSVYQGAPKELSGKAKHLRILQIDPKTYTYWYKRPLLSTGPVVSAVQSEGVKRILGTVPIESDGSVAFRAPSGIALHFQLLDEQYRALQTMRSFVGVMPGESRGCLGCHESHSRAPATATGWHALHREPRAIVPPPWSDDTVSYPRYVQPVLDQYCGDCHQGDGEARAVLDLTFRPAPLAVHSEPYLTLIGQPTWGAPYRKPENPPPGFGIADTLLVEAYSKIDPGAYVTPQPMKQLSYRSRLIEICASGDHYGVQVDPLNLRRLKVWIDTMCPYRGEEEVRAIDDPEFQGVDWLSIRPRIRTAPEIVRPGPVD